MKTEFASLISTQAKRQALQTEMSALAAQHGASIIDSDDGVTVLAVEHYRLSVHWKYPRVGAFLGHWYTDSQAAPDVRYPRTFATTIGGTLNTYHFGKATTCEPTWEGFKRSIAAGLDALAATVPV